MRAEQEAPNAANKEDGAAAVGEPLSPRLGSLQVWTGSELISFGGTLVDSALTTNGVVAIDPATLEVEEAFESPPFSASFGGGVLWVDGRIYFSGSECKGDNQSSGRYPEYNDCARSPVLATLDPKNGSWETLPLPTDTDTAVRILGAVPGVGVLASAGFDPTRLWARTADGDWTELPTPALQEARPGDNEPPLGYSVMGSCVVGNSVVQVGSERLPGTTSRDVTAAVLDLGKASATWEKWVKPELDIDGAPNILCGDDAVVFSPLTGPSGPITRFSPDDGSWTSIGPSTVKLDGVEPPYGILGLPGSTGREVVYPGAPGVGSQIVDISTGEWREGPPSPAMFENDPTFVGTGFVGVSATGTADDLVTPRPMDLPPTGSLFLFNVK